MTSDKWSCRIAQRLQKSHDFGGCLGMFAGVHCEINRRFTGAEAGEKRDNEEATNTKTQPCAQCRRCHSFAANKTSA